VADLLLACRAVHAAYDRFDQAVAGRLGVSRNDLRCLNLLEFGPLGVGEVGRRLGLSSGATTALVDRLEAAGLVRRTADPADRRATRVEATPLVYARLAGLYRRLADEVGERFAGYSPTAAAAAVRCLTDVAAACAAAEPAAAVSDR
jgi:DNA-binding MarR family transcriptional regulator